MIETYFMSLQYILTTPNLIVVKMVEYGQIFYEIISIFIFFGCEFEYKYCIECQILTLAFARYRIQCRTHSKFILTTFNPILRRSIRFPWVPYIFSIQSDEIIMRYRNLTRTPWVNATKMRLILFNFPLYNLAHSHFVSPLV